MSDLFSRLKVTGNSARRTWAAPKVSPVVSRISQKILIDYKRADAKQQELMEYGCQLMAKK